MNVFESALLNTLQEVTKELATLRAENRSRSRERSYTPLDKRLKSARSVSRRDQTPGRRPVKLYDGKCWYHYTHSDKSYKCKEGCRHWDEEKYRKNNQEN